MAMNRATVCCRAEANEARLSVPHLGAEQRWRANGSSLVTETITVQYEGRGGIHEVLKGWVIKWGGEKVCSKVAAAYGTDLASSELDKSCGKVVLYAVATLSMN